MTDKELKELRDELNKLRVLEDFIKELQLPRTSKKIMRALISRKKYLNAITIHPEMMVRCPYCGVGPGKNCKSKYGYYAYSQYPVGKYHVARLRKAGVAITDDKRIRRGGHYA